MITKTCPVSGKQFTITDDDLKFYEKMGVPAPTLCPDERQRRRLAWRNERSLHHRECAGTQKKIISMYDSESGFTVYDNEYWWSDSWSSLDYGRNFDFSADFFPQFHILNKLVPKMARVQQGENLNSRYTNCASYNKNCYLVFTANNNEDCMYGSFLVDTKDSLDSLTNVRSELTYEMINCGDCYDCKFLKDCEFCTQCLFCRDCVSCEYCFGCVNLRNKKYHFMNQPLSPEEYKKKLSELKLGAYSNLKNLRTKFFKFSAEFPFKNMTGLGSENCCGDMVYFSKNAQDCFDVEYIEDCKYLQAATKIKDSYDVSYYGCSSGNELLYECEGVGHGVFNSKFCKLCWSGCSNLEYCYECFGCQDCFGCTGLKKSQYCILNKQYTKEEYEKIRGKIIEHMKQTGEWGEFFPISLSPFAYNETVAQEYFPLDKISAEKLGYRWRDNEPSSKYISSEFTVPDDIADVTDDICDQILTCEQTGKHYKIQPAELKFYRQMNLPIPRLCPDARHEARMKLRNPRKLWDRKCDECEKDIQTTFAPDRPEKVLCEECYLQTVI